MENKKGWFINKWQLITFAIISLILLTGGWFNRGRIWSYIIKEEKQKQEALQVTIDEQDELILDLNDSLESQASRVDNEKIYIDEYKDDYIREYNRRIKLEQAMDSILYARFGKHYLDSLAEYIRYK